MTEKTTKDLINIKVGWVPIFGAGFCFAMIFASLGFADAWKSESWRHREEVVVQQCASSCGSGGFNIIYYAHQNVRCRCTGADQ